MPAPLDYANPSAQGRLRETHLPDGAKVIEVPRSRAPIVSTALRALAGLVGLTALMTGLVFSVDAPSAFVPVGWGFVLAGLVAMGFVAWSTLAAPVRRPSEARLRFECRRGVLWLIGPDLELGGPRRFDPGEIRDVRLGFDGGLEGAAPYMNLTLNPFDDRPLKLLGEQDPADLLYLAEVLRSWLGLPSRTERLAGWLRRRAPDREWNDPVKWGPPGPPSPALQSNPGPRPVLPVAAVLEYATPIGAGWRGHGVEFRADRFRYWLPADARNGRGVAVGAGSGGFIELSADALLIVSPDAVRGWRCELVYGVFVGAPSEWSPLAFCVFAADGVTRLLDGAEPDALRAAARLVNRALGTVGSVYSTESR